jgi:chromate reductase
MKNKVIGVVVGSARKASFSKVVAKTLMRLMPDGFEMRLLEIEDLPLYNQDIDDGGAVPEAYGRFRRGVKDCDGYLFVTPEHNRSIPALLKNALDVASRPYGSNVWSGKPGAVVSVSTGNIGGFGSNHITRQSMVFLDVFMMQQPEAYIGNVIGMLDDNGAITGEKSLDFLKTIADGFAAWVRRF